MNIIILYNCVNKPLTSKHNLVLPFEDFQRAGAERPAGRRVFGGASDQNVQESAR